MANIPPKKPVNDLIKFWAEKQKEKDPEQISKSSQRPLSPNTSSPPSRNESFFPKSSFRDPPSNSSPLISEGNDDSANNSLSIVNLQTLSRKNEQGRMDWNSLPKNDSFNEETSSPLSIMTLKSIPPVPAKD